jgi:hypothetical protein
VVPVKVVLQVELLPLVLRVQGVVPKVPPAPVIVHATVPSGGPLFGVEAVFVSVAVQVVEAPPIVTVVDRQETLSVLLSFWFASVNVACARRSPDGVVCLAIK